MKPRIFFMIAGVIVVLGFLLPKAVAVTVTLSEFPKTVDQNQEVDISVLLDCQNCSSASYLRGVFYSAGSSNYFGFTHGNDSSWVNAPGGSCTQYFEIPSASLHEGTWSGILKIKPDIESTYFKGPGEYLFKVGRYTGSCGSPIWSNEQIVAITGPTHTPSPSHTTTPIPTAVPTVTPTNRPTVTNTATVSPTSGVSHTPISIQTPSPNPKTEASPSSVLGTSQQKDIWKPLPIASDASQSRNKPIIISLLLIASGFALLSGLFAWKKHSEISQQGENYV